MFDAGFTELLLVFVVALIVIGPERMPEAVRAVLSFSRTVKRTLHNARLEIEKQIGADDIRRQLHNEEIMRSLNESKAAIENAVNETGDVIKETGNTIHQSVSQPAPVAPPTKNEPPADNRQP
ncbi:MAG TPA: Sec-independent protein translocase protein TatB [Pseudomonadales bacterium]|nr:Sec-independent protein translocase protein TatB [Pseudomonadales bacterium]